MYAFTSLLPARPTSKELATLKPPPSRSLPSRSPQVNTATDDKLGIGIDVALVTLVFLGFGYLLDRWLDTKPVFMIVLVVVALVGEFMRFWYAYNSKMKVLEAERAAASHREGGSR